MKSSKTDASILFRKFFGTKNKVTAAEDNRVQTFIFENVKNNDYLEYFQQSQTELKHFLHRFISESKSDVPIALVSSGGTTVPLEQNGVRCISNFSSGNRGSALVESLLRHGYYVIFISRRGALQPFLRHFARDVGDNACGSNALYPSFPLRVAPLDFSPDIQRRHSLDNWIAESEMFSSRYITLYFETVAEYLMTLKYCCITISAEIAVRPLMVVLAAAVSDFYIPFSALPMHKIQSKSDSGVIPRYADEIHQSPNSKWENESVGELPPSLTLNLFQVPKALGLISSKWLPKFAFVVGFKLETDFQQLDKKAFSCAKLNGLPIVVGNLLCTSKEELFIYSVDTNLNCEHMKRSQNREIEIDLVEKLCNLHVTFHAAALRSK